MANEISLTTTADATIYFVVYNASGSVWQTTTATFIAAVDANWANYDVAMTESGTSTGIYFGDFPSGITSAATYRIFAYSRVGSSPAVTDTKIAEGSIDWDGSGEVSDVSGTNLTSTSIVKEFLGISSTSDDAKIDTLVANVSAAAKTWLDRVIVSASYTEYRDGTGDGFIKLREYPVTAISRVAYGPETALRITNTSTSNQRATIALSSTAMSLTRVASGISSSSTLVLASYATITLLATAINALGNGWSAATASTYGSWATSDLKTIQGAASAIPGPAELYLYPNELCTWRLDDGTGLIRYGSFPYGFQNIRIDYTAGYSSIPADLQQGVTMAVAQLYNLSQADQTLKKEKIGDYSYEAVNFLMFDDPVFSSARALLEPYRRKGMF